MPWLQTCEVRASHDWRKEWKNDNDDGGDADADASLPNRIRSQ